MKHKWVLKLVDGEFKPVKLSDELHDTLAGNGEAVYEWKKVEYGDATINYVCYYEGKEVGFIPVDWADDDLEMEGFWKEKQTLRDVMTNIMDRHWKTISNG